MQDFGTVIVSFIPYAKLKVLFKVLWILLKCALFVFTGFAVRVVVFSTLSSSNDQLKVTMALLYYV